MTKDEMEQSSFLIVDDDEFSRDLIVSVLTHLGGTRFHCAQDSAEALRLAQHHRPDFVMLDIYMPEVDGWAFLEQLRKAMPNAVVIMITGSGRPDDFKKSMQHMVDGYCIKPVSPSVMQRSLEGAILGRRAIQR